MGSSAAPVHVHASLRSQAQRRGVPEWVDALPATLAALARRWGLSIGPPYETGTEAYVAPVTREDGTPAVLKVLVPWPRGPVDHEPTVLRLVGGHGCVRLLDHDEHRGALLLEALGRPLDQLDLPTTRRHEIMCDTLGELWRAAAARASEVLTAGLPTGAEKAVWLAAHITDWWGRLDQPCSRAAVDHALACAERRRRAHDPRRATLVHGDVHQWNTLAHPDGGYRFVDPDGLYAEPEYDLGILMREDPDEPDDPLRADPQRRARWLADRTGLDAEAIWEWGVVERVSTGLLATALGLQPVGTQMLSVADRIAE